MKKAVLFDLDGTLWDSSQSVTNSWNDVLAKHPEAPQITLHDMHGFMGKQLDEIAQIMMPSLPESKRMSIMNECMDYETEYLKERCEAVLYPKLRETLERLAQDYKLMIVSNCQDGYIQIFLEFSGLGGLFSDFESAGKTGLSKGENNRLIIARNGIEKAVYVGDTQGDLNSADFAGIPFVFAEYGFGAVDRKTESVKNFAELPEILTKIFAE